MNSLTITGIGSVARTLDLERGALRTFNVRLSHIMVAGLLDQDRPVKNKRVQRARLAARLYVHLTRRSRNAFPLQDGALVRVWGMYSEE